MTLDFLQCHQNWLGILEQGTGVEPFLVQIHPPLTFSDDFAQLI